MSSGGAVSWSTERKSDAVDFIGRPPTIAVVVGEGDNWRAAKSAQIFSYGRHFFEFEITKDAATSNTWRIVVGVVPSHFDCSQRSFTCVGSNQGGWGYVGGTGKKYNKAHGDASAYGPTFTTGDTIGVLLDFPKKSISFFKNKQDLGVAFTDLSGPVQLAVSMTAKDAKVTLRSGGDPVEQKDAVAATPVSDKDRLATLESDFFSKFQGAHIDMSAVRWSSPLNDLALMGFSQLDGLEALLVTGDGHSTTCSESDLAKAIDYLFLAADQRRAKYDEAARAAKLLSTLNPFVGQPAAPANPTQSSIDVKLRDQISTLRQKFEAERKQHEQEKRALEREMYREVLAAVIADGAVNRAELERLEELRKKRRISMQTHEQVLTELGVSADKYQQMVSKARDEEEALRKYKASLAATATSTPIAAHGLTTIRECVVCIDKVAEFVMLDCMHVCLCEDCRGAFTKPKCPICDRDVKEVRKVY